MRDASTSAPEPVTGVADWTWPPVTGDGDGPPR
jgi:hypothetical protein